MFSKNPKISTSVPAEILQAYYHEISSEKLICRAPFTSLYFHPDGEVGACCLNKKSYFYGKYPEDSIKKILASNPRKVHQKYIAKNNFSLGCSICNENLIDKNFYGLLANGYKNQSLKKHITRIDFELSHKCNFDCIMCERDKNSSESIYKEDFIKEIKPLLRKTEYVNFIGGEPFLINIYYDIWTILKETNPSCLINVQTNGSILNERILKILENKNFLTVISLDSVKKPTYQKIRKGGNLESVLCNFDIFNQSMQRKEKTMQISVCPLRTNRYEIPEIIEFANNKSCNVFFNHVERPKNLSLKYLPSQELHIIIESYKKFGQQLNSSAEHVKNNLKSLQSLIMLLIKWYEDATEREKNAVEISNKYIASIFSNVKNEQNLKIINELLPIIPETFMISASKYGELETTDFEDKLNQLRMHGLNQEEIIKIALNFFEIYNFLD